MEHTKALTSLTTREAIADCLSRCIVGIDDQNPEMFKSSMIQSEDTSFVIGTNVVQGVEAINAYILGKILPLTTTHLISNVRIDVKDGADTAIMTANAVAYHWNPKDAFLPDSKAFISGGLYHIDVVKDSDGLWKTKKWTLKMLWTQGDRSVMDGWTNMEWRIVL